LPLSLSLAFMSFSAAFFVLFCLLLKSFLPETLSHLCGLRGSWRRPNSAGRMLLPSSHSAFAIFNAMALERQTVMSRAQPFIGSRTAQSIVDGWGFVNDNDYYEVVDEYGKKFPFIFLVWSNVWDFFTCLYTVWSLLHAGAFVKLLMGKLWWGRFSDSPCGLCWSVLI